MVEDYKSRKNDVLASYDTSEELISALVDNAKKVGTTNPLKRLDALITDIRRKAKNVRDDRFSLMIVGESKSGKSTFINAYLGVELLTMDALQCTSAIIEIKWGKEFFVRATYADGRKQEIKGDAESREFLRKNAALDDGYRDIPVPTINNEILVKSGLRAKAKGRTIRINDREVKDLLDAPEVLEANIHNTPVRDYKRKIREYISAKESDWFNIVTKIEVFFPFEEDLRGIEIIDSPGVCARGGVAEITSGYIERADAIVFLKSVSGQALESTQFNQFYRNASVERNRDTLFLILTHIAEKSDEDLRILEKEAHRIFSDKVKKENILLVDSKAELYANRFSSLNDEERLAELRKLNSEGKMESFLQNAWNRNDFDLQEHDFISKLHCKSRFAQIYTALELFGRKAHYILMGDLLKAICKLYTKLDSDLITQIEMFKQKAEDPTELAKKIAKIKQELDVINNKIGKGVDNVVRRFRADDGVIRTTAEECVNDFKNKISSINDSSNDAFKDLRRYSFEKIDEYIKLTERLQEEVVDECDKELIALGDKATIPYESLKPTFTEEMFDEVKNETKSKATVSRSVSEGVTFKKTRSIPEYSQNKHYDILKNRIITELKTIKNALIDNLSEFAEEIRTRYIKELSDNAEAKKKELDSIMEAKVTAEQIKIILEELTEFSERISSAKSEAIKIKGGIEKNV